MGLQKSKRGKSRTHRKRSAWSKLDSVQSMTCPNCHEPKLPHRVCPACGYYDGRKVGTTAEAPVAAEN